MGLLTDALQTIRGHKIFANDVTVKGKLRLEGEITRTRKAGFKLDMSADVDVGTLKLLPYSSTARLILDDVAGSAAWVLVTKAAQYLPNGAKAILVRGSVHGQGTATGFCNVAYALDSGNTATPTIDTHPVIQLYYYSTTSDGQIQDKDLIIPLTASLQFYYYRCLATNVTNPRLRLSALGYYS